MRKDVGELAQSAKEKVGRMSHMSYNHVSQLISVSFQSVEVFDYVKKDFDEFTQTVQEEVSSTATALKEKLKV